MTGILMTTNTKVEQVLLLHDWEMLTGWWYMSQYSETYWQQGVFLECSCCNCLTLFFLKCLQISTRASAILTPLLLSWLAKGDVL